MKNTKPSRSPPELDAIVDKVLAYNPKDAKTVAKQKRRARDNGAPTNYF